MRQPHGQNFLTDKNIAHRIVESADIQKTDTVIEIGPGKVLAGLNKKIVPQANVYNVFDKASLDATIAALKEQLAGV